jgi:hypothetical protein
MVHVGSLANPETTLVVIFTISTTTTTTTRTRKFYTPCTLDGKGPKKNRDKTYFRLPFKLFLKFCVLGCSWSFWFLCVCVCLSFPSTRTLCFLAHPSLLFSLLHSIFGCVVLLEPRDKIFDTHFYGRCRMIS